MRIRDAKGDLALNPNADKVFDAGDTVIVMGQTGDIERFRGEFGI
jgi:K+/H+ antiporter YhaU regulatory subunit KhtT